MSVLPQPLRTLWLNAQEELQVINQIVLPHKIQVETLKTTEEVFWAIKNMLVRGAPLIGATAAYGIWLAAKAAPENDWKNSLALAHAYLRDARPTAVNLSTCLDRMRAAWQPCYSRAEAIQACRYQADAIVEEDIEICFQIGQHGLKIIEEIAARKNGRPVQILTHCNAGMMGCIRWGTISSPIYQALAKGIKLHVWVDETRPRNQGSKLTAWEFEQHGVPHSLIVDNAGGHLMQHQLVDMVLVGTDRTTREGDVANKIGTYLKALAAKDNNIPFYVALPSTTIDWSINDGLKEIPIEERDSEEVRFVDGLTENGQYEKVRICPENTPARNYGFDVTPARLVSGLITERGFCAASREGLEGLFPEKK